MRMHARQSYLERFGTPKTLEELADHTVIGFDHENEMIRRFQKQFGAFSRSSLSFRADSDLAQLAAIRAGFGIGICQSALAKRDKNLVRVLPRKFSIALDTWIVMHEDLRGSPRCSATFSALAEGIGAYIKGHDRLYRVEPHESMRRNGLPPIRTHRRQNPIVREDGTDPTAPR